MEHILVIVPATGDAYCEVKQQTPKIVVTPVLTPNVSSSVSQDGSTNRSNQITEFQTYLKEREGLYNKIEAISEGVGQELAVETEQDYEGQNQKSIDAGNLELEVVKLQIPKLPDDLSNALVKDKILLGKYADDVSQSASWMAMQIKAKIIDQNDGKDPYLSDNSDYQLTQDRTPQKYQTFHQLFHDDSQQINDNMQYIITATTNNFGSN